MYSSKIFKFTNVLENEDFKNDFNLLSGVEKSILRDLLKFMLVEKNGNIDDEKLFAHFDEKGININQDEIKKALSILFFIDNFYVKHPRYIDELELVKKDIINKNILEDRQPLLFESLEIIYHNLKEFRIKSNIKSYKKDFLPTINNVSYSTNIKLVKEVMYRYDDISYQYDDEVPDFFSSTTLKIDLNKKDSEDFTNMSFIIQLTKDDIEELIKVLEYAKKDMHKANEKITFLKKSIEGIK